MKEIAAWPPAFSNRHAIADSNGLLTPGTREKRFAAQIFSREGLSRADPTADAGRGCQSIGERSRARCRVDSFGFPVRLVAELWFRCVEFHWKLRFSFRKDNRPASTGFSHGWAQFPNSARAPDWHSTDRLRHIAAYYDLRGL